MSRSDTCVASPAKEPKKPKRDLTKPPGAGENRCHHYVADKGRYCPFTTKAGSKYCGEHTVLQDGQSQRIPCPYDRSHSVDIHRLKRHMASLCNARPPAVQPAYVNPDLNVTLPPPNYGAGTFAECGKTWSEEGLAKADARLVVKPGELLYLSPESDSSDGTRRNTGSLSAEAMESLMRPIIAKYLEGVPCAQLPAGGVAAASFADLLDAVHVSAEFKMDVTSHTAVDQPKSWKQNQKYARQQSSLVGHMDQRGMLNPEFCFVEFGAGKGELSVYVHSVLETRRKAGNTIVLVDRQNARRKFQIIQEDPGQEKSAHDHFHRILIDIRDLDLGQIKELQFVDEATGQTRLRPIVAYSKHLCGAATDLTIKCLENYQNAGGKVAGMAIALCCHQVCKYSMMLDHDYLSQAIPRTQPDNDNAWDNGQRELFYRLTSMSSWAINVPAQLSDAKQDPSLFTQDSRTRIGHAIKRFIDIGRVQYVRQHLGLPNAELVYYAPRATSPENLMLVATGDACF